MNRSKWDRRIQRADELAAALPFAAEVLRFYKRTATLQSVLYSSVARVCRENSANDPGRLCPRDLDLNLLRPRFAEFLSGMETTVSQPIASSAKELRLQQAERWSDLLSWCWENACDFQPALGNAEALLGWLFLQPYAESLAEQSARTHPFETRAVCPFCFAKPQVGVLRPEGDGGKRFLICSVCSTEWAYGRIVCPACGEETVDKLAVYTASQFSHVRVEACDTCGHYIKTIDLTKNGLAVPVVDELATIPLNLWAYEHGYVKLRANVLGI